MFKFCFFLFFSLFCFVNTAVSQNYLRVRSPQTWMISSSQEDGWEEYTEHGQFDEITITAEPKGVFTEVSIYTTISANPGFTYYNNIEIIWQFELPEKTIVHDAWLWVGETIVKADLIDYWTALETYTEFVSFNTDPLFFYKMPDNRYELRVFPLPVDGSRRLKISFLVPAQWDASTVEQQLLQPLFRSTDYMADEVTISVPMQDMWGTPSLQIGENTTLFSETALGGAGDSLHLMKIAGNVFAGNDPIKLSFDAPYDENNTFVSVYSDSSEHFYQAIYAPDWQGLLPDPNPAKTLFLIEYDASKTSLTEAAFVEYFSDVVTQYLAENEPMNIAMNTSGGVQFLSADWWPLQDAALPALLANLLAQSDTNNLSHLLEQGYAWAANHTDITDIYLLAASDVYVYPPFADAMFAQIAPSILPNVPLTIFDYQNEELSQIYYQGTPYTGNAYFYQLLTNSVDTCSQHTLYSSATDFTHLLSQTFPPTPALEDGFVNYQVSMEAGLTFLPYNFYQNTYSADDPGVFMQTGRYVGNLPLQINAAYFGNDGTFLTSHQVIEESDAHQGDSLLMKAWYGPHFKYKESQIATDADRTWLIETSIEKRILTGLTAFLALEPDFGGEPCIVCNLNNGNTINTDDTKVDSTQLVWELSPNPASDYTTIRLTVDSDSDITDGHMEIIDLTGKTVFRLEAPAYQNNQLVWQWNIGREIPNGVYWAKVRTSKGAWVTQIVVAK